MKRVFIVFIFIFIFISVESYSQTFNTIPFPYYGIFYICDFDNDGDIDTYFAEADWDIGINPLVFFNNNGVLNLEQSFIPNEMFGIVPIDINNDNYFDLVSSNGRVYINNSGTFAFRSTDFLGFNEFDVGDYNSDNDVDIITDGHSNDSLYLYKNNSTFFDKQQAISGFSSSNIMHNLFFFDYDNDGDVDVFNAGYPHTTSWLLTKIRIYSNGNGLFNTYTELSNPELFNIVSNGAEFRDYDHDMDMDLLILEANSLRLFQNNNGSFIQIKSWNISNISYFKWVDIDNNGFADILFSNNSGVKVIKNNFPDWIEENVLNSYMSEFSAVDYDNDGDFDLFLGTYPENSIAFNQLVTGTFRQNIKPSSPTNLSINHSGSVTYFSWSAATDDSTPQQALTYNMYIGTASGKTDIMSPLSDLATGHRKIVSIGNVDANLGWKINNLPPGTYYWSVQAIDNTYEGSAFAIENSFTIGTDFLFSELCYNKKTVFEISNSNGIQSVLWNYGDSQTSTELNPTHTYANPGTYTVTLTVTYTNNSTQTITKEVEIYYNPLIPTIQHD